MVRMLVMWFWKCVNPPSSFCCVFTIMMILRKIIMITMMMVKMFTMVVIIMITMMMVRWWLCWSTFLLSQAVVRPIPSCGEEFYVSLDFKNLRLVFKFSADFYFFSFAKNFKNMIFLFCFDGLVMLTLLQDSISRPFYWDALSDISLCGPQCHNWIIMMTPNFVLDVIVLLMIFLILSLCDRQCDNQIIMMTLMIILIFMIMFMHDNLNFVTK